MGLLDASFSGQIFRKDHKPIIAQNRLLASILPVRLAYSVNDYIAGTVLARNTTSGNYQPYVSGGASGTGTAACVLFEGHGVNEFASSGDTTAARGVFGGEVFKDNLIGLDSGAITNLGAKTIIDATGINVLKY